MGLAMGIPNEIFHRFETIGPIPVVLSAQVSPGSPPSFSFFVVTEKSEHHENLVHLLLVFNFDQ